MNEFHKYVSSKLSMSNEFELIDLSPELADLTRIYSKRNISSSAYLSCKRFVKSKSVL
jgi:hypothetical protein